jgi:hypothetical protein
MSAVDTLRARAAKLADQLRTAEAKAEAEQAEVTARNAERRTAHWETARTNTLPRLQQAATDARTAFSQVVADGGDVLGSYLTYRRAYVEHQTVRNACADALAVYVHDLTGKPNEPGDRSGRATYPDGLGVSHSDPEPFARMLEDATMAADRAHAQMALADVQAPLQAALEPEDDQ